MIIYRELQAILGNLLNFGVHGTAVSIFSLITNHQMESAGSAGGWCFQHQCVQGVLNKIRETRMGFFMD